jgi:hypothetical protein
MKNALYFIKIYLKSLSLFSHKKKYIRNEIEKQYK